jgi:hypothetical protein
MLLNAALFLKLYHFCFSYLLLLTGWHGTVTAFFQSQLLFGVFDSSTALGQSIADFLAEQVNTKSNVGFEAKKESRGGFYNAPAF